jgi:hypothetical protein
MTPSYAEVLTRASTQQAMGREVGHTWPRSHEPAKRRKAPQWERRRGGSALDSPCGWARCPAPVVPGIDISRALRTDETQSRLPTGQSARVTRRPGQLHRAAVCSTVRPLGRHHSGGGAGARPRSAARGGGRRARPMWYLAPAYSAVGRPDTACTRRRVRNDARWHSRLGPPHPRRPPGCRCGTGSSRPWPDPVGIDDRRAATRSRNRARGCSPERRERGSVAPPRSSAWPWQRPRGHRQRSLAAEGPRGAVG